MPKEINVAFCMPVGSQIDPMTFQSYRFLDRTGVNRWHHFDMIGFPVETARNEITWAVLNDAPEVTHLLWCDSVIATTPILVRRRGSTHVDFYEISELFPPSARFKTKRKEYAHIDCEVLTHEGWQVPNAIMQHRVKKPIVTVIDDGRVSTTEDHSLMSGGQKLAGKDVIKGSLLDHVSIEAVRSSAAKPQRDAISEDFAEVLGFFAAEGTTGVMRARGGRYNGWFWTLSNCNEELLRKYAEVLSAAHARPFHPIRDDSHVRDDVSDRPVYQLRTSRPSEIGPLYREMFYAASGAKKVPDIILNASEKIISAFIHGYELGDGHVSRISADGQDRQTLCTNSEILAAGLQYLYGVVGRDVACVAVRPDKPHIVQMYERVHGKERKKTDGVRSITRNEDFDGWVYDLNTDAGTFVGGIGLFVLHNSDMVFPSNALQQLLRHDKDFVGGLCFDRRHPFKPVIARLFDKSWGFDPKTMGWLFDYPKNQLIEVDGTGGAFLLIKRAVFERIRELEGKNDPAWRGWWTCRDGGLSEDLSFCERVKESGFKLFVDTGLGIGHVGRCIINEEYVKRNRDFEYEQWHERRGALEDAAHVREADEATKNIDQGLQKPIASIVIPVYNQKPEYLRGAVLSALNQTVPVEVIVVDDGSAEPVSPTLFPKTLFPHDLKIIRHAKNRGIAATLNTGIKAMTTDWFCWLSSDDMFEPNKVEYQLAALLATRSVAGYHGYTLKVDNGNGIAHVRVPTWSNREAQNQALANFCCINGSTVMLHRSVLDKVGLFDEDMRYSQDWELWRRIGFQFDWFGMLDKLTSRREFQNLTVSIAVDEAKREIRDGEDRLVRAMVAPK